MKYLFLFCTVFSFLIGGEDPKVLADCRVYFSSQDHLGDKLNDLIAKENRSIRIAIYGFFHREIADALIKAKKRGVDIEIIVDPFSVKKRSPLKRMARAGIPIYVWDAPPGQNGKSPLMHNKFSVFGDRVVWTGSFNFTFEADRFHSENAVVIASDIAASRYLEEYQKIKSKAKSLDDYTQTK